MDKEEINIKELQINLLNKEMDESLLHLNRHHEHVKFYVQTYIAAISGYIALCGYFGSKLGIQPASTANLPVATLQSAGPSVKLMTLTNSMALIGGAVTIIIFIFGWLIQFVFAHKLPLMTMIHKHMAELRNQRLNTVELTIDHYTFDRRKEDVKMSRLLYHLPYALFGLNYLLLFSGIVFFSYEKLGFQSAFILSLAIGAVFGLVYPVVCTKYRIRLKAADEATSFSDMVNKEIKIREIIKHKKGRRKYYDGAVLFFLIGLLWVLFKLNLDVDNSSLQNIFTVTAFLLTISFGLYRYHVEFSS